MEIGVKDNNIDYLKLLFESGESSDVFQQKIADFFPALIYVYDADKKKLRYINRKITDLLGYSYEDIREWDNDFMKFIFKDDADLVQKELEKYSALKEDDNHSYNSRFNHKEGQCKYFRTQGTILRRNDNGTAASILFVAQDITDQMQTAEESKGLKELFHETELLLHFGTWSWTKKTNHVEWSEGMYQLMGYDKETVSDKNSYEHFLHHLSEKDRPRLSELVTTAMNEKKEYEAEFEVTTLTGEKKTVSTKGKPIINKEGELIKIIGVTRNITEQSRVFKDLSDYRQMMLDKEKFLGSGSWEFNFRDGRMAWSDGKYRLFGYDPASLIIFSEVNDALYRKHVSENDMQKIRESWEDLLKNKEENTWEYEIVTETGERRRIETYGRIIRDESGSPAKIIGTSRDITKIRDYEESLKQKIDELDKSNKELEEFAYIASHDLQEPLRKITAFSERLKDRSGPELGKEGTIYLDRMMVATENMRLLINNLLEFSRTSRHNQSFSKVDLNKIIAEVKADLELKIEETNAFIIADDLPAIEGIPAQIRQLFTNLFLNSIKFKSSGASPKIYIQSQKLLKKEKEQLQLRMSRSYIKIIVKDEGIGFEQEYALKIFQIFQRLHGKSEYPGSGIGLAICKKIAENHKGIIYAESDPGKGASFFIILPENQY